MNLKIKSLVEDFRKTHDVETVIIYGSYAKGDSTSVSDLDLLGIKAQTSDYTDVRLIEGVQLDGWITSSSRLSKTEDFLKLKGGLLYCDTDQVGERLLKEVEDLYHEGPKTLSTNEREQLEAWIRKMVLRGSANDLEGRYRLNWLLHDLLFYYFKLRDRWFLGPKTAFKILKAERPDIYDLYVASLENPQDHALIKQLSEKIVQPEP